MKLGGSTRLVALTGAGISAESGIRTFRDSGGLWEQHAVEDVATVEAFERNPSLVWTFYKQRFEQAVQANPNPGHYALVELENYLGNNFSLITQNVDNLHTLAGSRNIIEMHGNLYRCFCTECDARFRMQEIDLTPDIPLCGKCGASLRPDIVWFGEIPYCLYEIEQKLKNCDVFLMIGTSGIVYPAAGFVMTAKYFGARIIAVNLEPMNNQSFVDEFHCGSAGQILPGLVKEWTG